MLPRCLDEVSMAATTFESSEALAETLLAANQLRNAAVHRYPITTREIERMLHNGLILATSFQDQTRTVKLRNILEDLQTTMQDMEFHRNKLQSQLDGELGDIQNQRDLLDRKEKEAKLNLRHRNRENTATISSLFEKSIKKLASTDKTKAVYTDSLKFDLEKSESVPIRKVYIPYLPMGKITWVSSSRASG